MGGGSLFRLTSASQSPPPAQELLQESRQAAASAGLPLRPALPAAEEGLQELQIVLRNEPEMELPTARMDYTATKTVFLQCQAGSAGVLEVLKACRAEIMAFAWMLCAD